MPFPTSTAGVPKVPPVVTGKPGTATPVVTVKAYRWPSLAAIYATPPATTTPFSSTIGAVVCQPSVSGRLIVSDDAPAFEGVLRHAGQSAAKADDVANAMQVTTKATKARPGNPLRLLPGAWFVVNRAVLSMRVLLKKE